MNETQLFTSFEALFTETIGDRSYFTALLFTQSFNSYIDEDELEQLNLSFTVNEDENSGTIAIDLLSNFGQGTLTIEGEEQDESISFDADLNFVAIDSSTITGTLNIEGEEQDDNLVFNSSYIFNADGEFSDSGDLESESGNLTLTVGENDSQVFFDLNLESFDGDVEEEIKLSFDGTLDGNQVNGSLTTETIVNENSESTETQSFSFTVPDNTFTNNDSGEQPTLSINDISLAEGNESNTDFSFTVSLSEASTDTVTVDYATTDDSAVAGDDYTAVNGTLTFEPGEISQTITVEVIGDINVEENELFNLNLSNGTNSAIADERGSATITNDDLTDNLETIDLFRFRNTTFDTGTYVYVGAEERDAILDDPDLNQTFEFEGLAFKASVESGENLIPLYRIRSLQTPGTYLFVGIEEYDAIFAEDSDQKDNWVQEGLGDGGNDIPEFYMYGREANLGIDFNRFQNTQNNTFIYTGPEETASILENPNLSNLFLNQGGAFEALG